MLYFVYASVVSEKEVILQTRPQLLMGDCAMTEPLPGAALLPGGTDRKAIPNEQPRIGRADYRNRGEYGNDSSYYREEFDDDDLYIEDDSRETHRAGSLPPIIPSGTPRGRAEQSAEWQRPRRRPLSERRHVPPSAILPRMGYARPEVPLPPYQFVSMAHAHDEAGRYEYPPPYVGIDSIKQPLISSFSRDSDSLSARTPLLASTSRSEPPLIARPPPLPPEGSSTPQSARRNRRSGSGTSQGGGDRPGSRGHE